MTAPRGAGSPTDPGRLLTEFLNDEAAPYAPPVLLPAVLARTALTKRRPAWRIRSWWSDMAIGRPLTNGRTTMSVLVRFMIPVFLVLAGGWYLVANSPGPSHFGGEPSPTASPHPLTEKTDLEPGATYAMDGPFGPGSPRMVFTVPGEGWSTEGVWNIGKDLEGGSDVHDVAMTPWRPAGVFEDPCRWQSGEMVAPLGPTVEDLVAALAQQPGGTVTSTTDVTVGGYAGTRLELTLSTDLDLTTCDGGEFWRWAEDPAPSRGGFVYGDGQHIVDYIIDVDGIRGVIDTGYLPGVPEADRAEMEALVESMRFEWPEASPSPGVSEGASTSP